VFITNSTEVDIVYLEARHRRHARVEDGIKTVKALGLDHFPSYDYRTNQAWLQTVLIACDLTAWTQALCFTGAIAKTEPKSCAGPSGTPPARSPPTARRSTLHLDATWPWAAILQQGFQRLDKLRFTT
jgi:hypothetical protein